MCQCYRSFLLAAAVLVAAGSHGSAQAQLRTTAVAGARYLASAGIVASGTWIDYEHVPTIGIAPAIDFVVTDWICVGVEAHVSQLAGVRHEGLSIGGGPRITYYFPRKMAPSDTIRVSERRLQIVRATSPVFYYLGVGFQITSTPLGPETASPNPGARARVARPTVMAGTLHFVTRRVALHAELAAHYDERLDKDQTEIPVPRPLAILRAGFGASATGGVRLLL